MILHFVLENWYLFAALVVILAMLALEPIRQRALGVENVGTGRAVQIVNHEAGAFVDVREPDEFKRGHIPKARNIPLSTLPGRLKEIESYKAKPVVVYCMSGSRSAKAAALMRKHGFGSVFNLAGGFSHWERENLPAEH